MWQRLGISFLLALLYWLVLTVCPVDTVWSQERGAIYQVEVRGIVTVMTVGYLERAIAVAEASNATALIIQLSNRGAVIRDIRPLAERIAQSTVPIVVYVAPPGTQSGAAGTLLLSASHIAAMAPNTSFGISAPLVHVRGTLSEATQHLLLDSMVRQLREWNEQRGRSVAWVGQAVHQGLIMTNEQAFATTPPTINLVAQDMEELLLLLQGRMVTLKTGHTLTMQTLGKTPKMIVPSLWERLLFFLAHPTTMFLLLVMGCTALCVELTQPGVGIFTGIALVLLGGALVGVIVLPIRWISLVGCLLAFALIAADMFIPSHGGLTLIGVVLLVISAMTLVDAAQAPGVFVALWAIALVALIIAAFAAVVVWFVVQLRSQPVATGGEGLIGKLAEVRERLAPEGMVFVEGAYWRAICEEGEVEKGAWVRVVAVHALRLVVRPIHPSGPRPTAASQPTGTEHEKET